MAPSVLLQMLDRNGWVAGQINHYSKVDDWDRVVLASSDVLFITCVLRSFITQRRYSCTG